MASREIKFPIVTYIGRDRKKVSLTSDEFDQLMNKVLADKELIQEMLDYKKIFTKLEKEYEQGNMTLAELNNASILPYSQKIKKKFPVKNKDRTSVLFALCIGEIVRRVDEFIKTEKEI